MTKELNDKLENIVTHSAWTFDEAVLLLTGRTLFEIERVLSKSPPTSSDLKWIKVKKTRLVEPGSGKAIHFKKGEIVFTSEDLLKRLVSEGSGKEVECPATIKTGREEYRKAQDQSKLLKNLERAVRDHDIKALNETSQLSLPGWRLDKQSFVDWVHSKKKDLSPLRHFPNKAEDIFFKIKKGPKGGRPPFPFKDNVKKAVEKLLKRNPKIAQSKIPYMPEVVNSFALGKGYEASKEMSAEKYKKQFGWKVSTIKSIIADVYKTRS
jgi:hypothetical protein